MSIFGELENFFSDYIYPVWPLFLALAIIGAVAAGFVAYRLGWHHVALRHRLVTSIAVVALLAVTIPTGYYTISPLFERNTVCEASPIAGAGAGSERCEDELTVSVPGGVQDVDTEPTPTATSTPPTEDADPSSSPVPSQTDDLGPTTVPGPPTDDQPDPTTDPTPTPTQGPTPFQAHVVKQGEFEGADSFHFGEGDALLIETAPGEYVLRFEEFSVRNGPDLFVYLSPSADGYADGALELGTLKGTDGAFNYEIPAGTDVSQFQSAIVWCKAFTVLFATAAFA